MAAAHAHDAGGVEDVDVLRATPEYRAAWEVELWKRREEAKFQKKLSEALQRATDARLEKIREREHHLEEEYRIKQRELAKLEEKRLREQAEFRDKRQLLDECERVLRKRKEELEKEYTSRLRESEDKLRRNKEDTAHKLNLEHIKQRQLAGANEELKQRLAELEGKYQQLWDDMARSKEGELKRHPIEAVNAAVEAAEERAKAILDTRQREWALREDVLQKKISQLTTANAKLKTTVSKLTLKCQQTKRRESQAAHAANTLAADNLVLVRTRGSSSPEARDESAAAPPAPEPLHEAALTPYLPALLPTLSPAALDATQRSTADEVVRLGREKQRLLSTGCYSDTSPVIVALTKQQEKLMRALV